ncbi:hypothetical protein ACFL59_12370 [Planctomycetota bacterium]
MAGLLASARRCVGVAVLVLGLLLLPGCAAGIWGPLLVVLLTQEGRDYVDTTQPDLVLGSVEGPQVATVVKKEETDEWTGKTKTKQRLVFHGDQGRLRANVVNIGTDRTGGTFKVSWYLSRHPNKKVTGESFRVRTLDITQNLEIGSAIRVVSEGAATVAEEEVLEPLDPYRTDAGQLTAGTYYLIARANDGAQRLLELDGANNDMTASVVVHVYEAPPDPQGSGTLIDETDNLPGTDTLDVAVTSFRVPTTAIVGSSIGGKVTVQNLNVRVPTYKVATMTRAAGVVTVSTTEAHAFKDGQKVRITHAGDSSFNTQDVAISVTGANTLTFAQVGPPPATIATGTVSLVLVGTYTVALHTLPEAGSLFFDVTPATSTFEIGGFESGTERELTLPVELDLSKRYDGNLLPAIRYYARVVLNFEDPVASGVGALENTQNNSRFAEIPLRAHSSTIVFSRNGAVLPRTHITDPTILSVTTERPQTSTFLPADGQRIFAFELPETDLPRAEAQAIITVRSGLIAGSIDPIAELLSPVGTPLAVADDFRGDLRSVLYTTLSASAANRTFFVVVSGANATDKGNFDVSIGINPTTPGDDQLVHAVSVGDVLNRAPELVEITQDTVLSVDFAMEQLETEFFFTLPAKGRFPLRIRPATPGATIDALVLDNTATTLVRFDETGKPTEYQLVLENEKLRVKLADGTEPEMDVALLQDPSSADGLFTLPKGEYVLVVRTLALPIPLNAPFKFEIGPGFHFGDMPVN